MEQLKLSDRHKNILRNFTRGLQDIYGADLVSLILYGSAASGEFVDTHSNLNVLAVLKNTDLPVLKRATKLVRAFRMVNSLFLTEEHIANSADIFPIEFLDMQDNHAVLYGKDVLKDMHIDMRNLQFQCEHELKVKLLTLRQAYVAVNGDRRALRSLLLASFTSVLHIARNLLRGKGRILPYLKDAVLKELALEFKIDLSVWETILSARNKKTALTGSQIEPLFVSFTRELESMVAGIDAA